MPKMPKWSKCQDAKKRCQNQKMIESQFKNVGLQYCKDVLAKSAPDIDVKKNGELGENLNQKIMKDKLGKVFMARKDTFEAVLHKFKINHKRNSDFLIKASEEFKEAVYKLFERIINNETIPENFTDTTLHQI